MRDSLTRGALGRSAALRMIARCTQESRKACFAQLETLLSTPRLKESVLREAGSESPTEGSWASHSCGGDRGGPLSSSPSSTSGPTLIIVDDNMQYRSMRYRCFQLARRYGAAVMQIHLRCPLELSLQRNMVRMSSAPASTLRTPVVPDTISWLPNVSDCMPEATIHVSAVPKATIRRMAVPEATIRRMAAVMEPPDAHVAWERPFLVLEAAAGGPCSEAESDTATGSGSAGGSGSDTDSR